MPAKVAIPTSLSAVRANEVGARPVRWRWWMVAFGISALLWLPIALLLGWI